MTLNRLILRIPTIVRWLLVIGWAAVIFRLSEIPGSDTPGRFGGLAHFVVYMVFGILLLVALYQSDIRPVVLMLAIALASIYGITDEIHQSFVPGRVPELLDWIIDTLGAAVGAGTVYMITKKGTARHPS